MSALPPIADIRQWGWNSEKCHKQTFITFYAVAGHNFPVPQLLEYEPLDVVVGTVILMPLGSRSPRHSAS
jgi:hypothetical protein